MDEFFSLRVHEICPGKKTRSTSSSVSRGKLADTEIRLCTSREEIEVSDVERNVIQLEVSRDEQQR